ncbi:3-carboxy-cis,cis-muconate cycloisomerase [Sneathiella chinensis]|uniref:3-carboxy-cis,cis-muconate cycloisomerase n=1 Tax=Sneathiella chinensis TaxID=349750 RepID=A0ABQ5TYF3_9PROT|nr:3-carboxy-cis,cis-muconate cycloisomerase [Sneathiella chinensis]GLQ04815.1 3-carboxy-cis,cis-muconate cycloisomerase [Sneathiella chinensis]
MSPSPFDHAYLSGLFGQPEASRHLSPKADVAAMLAFEAALAEAEGEAGLIPAEAAEAISAVLRSFSVDMDDLKQGTSKDGVVIPALVRQIRAAVGPDHGAHVHYGATSQDVIDTALILRLKNILDLFEEGLNTALQRIEALNAAYGTLEIMGRTRMQRALPIPLSHRLGNWKAPLLDLLTALEDLRPRLLKVQFGGAVGTLAKLGEKGPEVRKRLAAKLGLEDAECWHTDRRPLSLLAAWMSEVTTALGKIGQDLALMAQNEVGEVTLKSAGGSSAMPHKQNPVRAELLVSIARYNSVQISGMSQAALAENERSGSGWSLEWMILPGMVQATAAGLDRANELLSDIKSIQAS